MAGGAWQTFQGESRPVLYTRNCYGGGMRFRTVWEAAQTLLLLVVFVVCGLLVAKCMGRM